MMGENKGLTLDSDLRANQLVVTFEKIMVSVYITELPKLRYKKNIQVQKSSNNPGKHSKASQLSFELKKMEDETQSSVGSGYNMYSDSCGMLQVCYIILVMALGRGPNGVRVHPPPSSQEIDCF